MTVAFQEAASEAAPREWETAYRPVMPMEPVMTAILPWWKRAMDIVGATLALTLLSPVLLVTAAAVKLTSKGPAIIEQKRAGLGGKPFTFYKFRSMVVDAEGRKAELVLFNEQSGPVFKMKKDPRATLVGRLIRKLSVDEFPQFWNVLKGDMTLVGPRPPTLDEVPYYSMWQRRRLEVTPGITCFWRVSGRALVPFRDWVRMDIRYVAEWSLLTDLKILLLTLPAVLSCRGAY
jgi:lipopolysaccharide/colanic/teichoic acid biosynthesis glycosyltransferase